MVITVEKPEHTLSCIVLIFLVRDKEKIRH